MLDNDGLNMTQIMYGINARHVPAWMVVQNQGENLGVTVALASKSYDLLYGTTDTHVLILGEVIVRPHIAVASNDFVGHGIQGFWTHNPSAEEWLANGKVLIHSDRGIQALKNWR